PGAEPVSRSNSPSCGVSSSGVSGSRASSTSGCSAMSVIASASAHTGTPWPSASASTSLLCRPVPIPGPTTHACTRPASKIEPVATTSGQCDRTTSATGPAYRTMPAVARTAAAAVNTAAPGYVDEPAATPVKPCVYLLSSGFGSGHAAATSAASSCSRSGSPSSPLRPMSTSVMSPQCCGFNTCTGL